MTVGGAFVYVCESRVKDFEQRSRVYNAVRYNAVYITHFFPRGPRRLRYNGVAVGSRNRFERDITIKLK